MIDALLSLFSINAIFFTVLDYPMSYIEFFGTILYLWSVWLIMRKDMLTWPVSIVSVILYAILFYQIRLYSDTIEQIYFLGASVYGWWFWEKTKSKKEDNAEAVLSSKNQIIAFAILTVVLSIIFGYLMSRIHIFLPAFFPEAASFPYLDAATTVMSFVAMFLMAQKKIESWVYWIIVDMIGIGLYFAKNVRFISLLYVMLLILAINGFRIWLKDLEKEKGKKI